ncbi:hypothetical protein [Aquimarina mytili]|uniref:Uncharacterized protein n=1 Tax=Aquimarina mytili TaxID=874423 RepID=A0A937A447_9FLAO|nr:hypothetical protein [Aquimarina mytili]MBL0683989.1 hypothetical protein [Aquimarina mytili]
MNIKTSIARTIPKDIAETKRISKFRLYLMRGLYLLTFLTLGYSSWSEIISPSELWGPYDGVAYSFWAAYATIMGLGIRFPLQMLPLLLLQLFYKSVWLLGIYVPLWFTGQLDSTFEGFLEPFAIAIPIDLIVIPWGYVFRNYIKDLFKVN